MITHINNLGLLILNIIFLTKKSKVPSAGASPPPSAKSSLVSDPSGEKRLESDELTTESKLESKSIFVPRKPGRLTSKI